VKDSFPQQTATARVHGYAISGRLVELDQRNGLGLYYFSDDAVLGDGWDAWLTPEDARSAREVAALARIRYRRFRG